jgi:hypothetical protein
LSSGCCKYCLFYCVWFGIKCKLVPNFIWELDVSNQERNCIIKNLEGFDKPNNLSVKEAKQMSLRSGEPK